MATVAAETVEAVRCELKFVERNVRYSDTPIVLSAICGQDLDACYILIK